MSQRCSPEGFRHNRAHLIATSRVELSTHLRPPSVLTCGAVSLTIANHQRSPYPSTIFTLITKNRLTSLSWDVVNVVKVLGLCTSSKPSSKAERFGKKPSAKIHHSYIGSSTSTRGLVSGGVGKFCARAGLSHGVLACCAMLRISSARRARHRHR